MTKPHKITELFAWIVEHPDGEDGVPAVRGRDDMVMPLIGSDRERIESLRSAAMECAETMPVRLVRFAQVEILESHVPPKPYTI